ncbi:MAG: hypothetical protein ACXWHZ_03525 [Usitatibacter sp.]
MRTLGYTAIALYALSAILLLNGADDSPYWGAPIYPATVCAIAWFSARFWRFPR